MFPSADRTFLDRVNFAVICCQICNTELALVFYLLLHPPDMNRAGQFFANLFLLILSGLIPYFCLTPNQESHSLLLFHVGLFLFIIGWSVGLFSVFRVLILATLILQVSILIC